MHLTINMSTLYLFLIVPDENNEQHLQVLSTLAELFYSTEFRNQIRKAETNEELYYAALNFERQKIGNE